MKPAAGLSILVAAMLVSLALLASLSPSRALADELPKDTNQIESLTPEQAKTLLAEFTGRSNCLQLAGLTTLDADTAKVLAEFKSDYLFFNGLSTLDADTAKALAEFKGAGLLLDGLTTLNAATAKTLAEFKGEELLLNGLTTVDAATAKALAEFKGQYLCLNGLTTLDADIAKALAEFKGRYLYLDGLTTLDAATAKTLAEFKGDYLQLNGLTTLDADTAKALTAFEGRLSLSAKVQEAFCDKNPLTPETALVWAKLLQGDLKRLTTLDAETAKALAEFKGEQLLLNGLTTLDAATAKALAGSPAWSGDLSSIVAIESPDSVEIAVALATKKGPLSLPNLTKISPKTLTALIEKEDVEIPLIETLELIQEPDGSPTDDFMIPKGFQSRQKVRQQGR